MAVVLLITIFITTQGSNAINTDKYFGIEPKTKAFLESFPTGDPQLIKLSVNDARALLSNAQVGVKVTKLAADIISQLSQWVSYRIQPLPSQSLLRVNHPV